MRFAKRARSPSGSKSLANPLASTADDRRSRTVLIVDDHEDVRHMLRLLFESEGFNVVGEAANGDEALDLARDHQPLFVILDYLMPTMNGEQTAKWIHLVDPEVRVIAVSGVIRDPPSWADAFVCKKDVLDLIQLPERLLAIA